MRAKMSKIIFADKKGFCFLQAEISKIIVASKKRFCFLQTKMSKTPFFINETLKIYFLADQNPKQNQKGALFAFAFAERKPKQNRKGTLSQCEPAVVEEVVGAWIGIFVKSDGV